MYLKEEFIGFWTLLCKEVTRFLKVLSQTILSPIITSFLYLLVFGVSLSTLLKSQQGVGYLQFLIPGLVALSALNNSLQNAASSVMISKFHGDLQDLRVMPLSPISIALAYCMACVVRGLLVGFCVLILGEIVFYIQFKELFPIHHPFGLFLFLLLGSSIFGNIGIYVGFISKTFDHITAVTNFIVLPLIYLGGVFFSLSILHPFWQTVSKVNPLVYLISGIRWSVLDVSDIAPLYCFWASLGFAVFSCWIAWYSVKKGSYLRF